MKLQTIAILTFLTFANVMAQETTTTKYINSTGMEPLELTQEWDKTFPQSDKVEHKKITFHNRYGITLWSGKRRNSERRVPAFPPLPVHQAFSAVRRSPE